MPAGQLSSDQIRAVVRETLAAENEFHSKNIDDVVLKAVATILTSFGIEEEDRKELRADFQHLRTWRKSMEQVQGYTFKTCATIIIGGLLGALWMGVKAMVGK